MLGHQTWDQILFEIYHSGVKDVQGFPSCDCSIGSIEPGKLIEAQITTHLK
jgi:hypothetical protein